MSTEAIATFITVRRSDFNTIVDRMQNYWADRTVDGYRHYPFTTGSVTSNSSGGQSGISLDLALSAPLVAQVEAALAEGYFYQVSIRKFAPPPDGGPPLSYEILADFYGEVISASQDAAGLHLQVGSNLDPVEAQAPPRKFTTVLCGSPPQL
jgi:hypothetical protein